MKGSGSGAWCNQNSGGSPANLRPCSSSSSRHECSMSCNKNGSASVLSPVGSTSCSPRTSTQLPSSIPNSNLSPTAAGMSPSQRLLFTDDVELSGPLQLLQCAASQTLGARGSGSLTRWASLGPGSPASANPHAAAVGVRLQELGSPVRNSTAAGAASFEDRAQRRSTTGSLPRQWHSGAGCSSGTGEAGSPTARPAPSTTSSHGGSSRQSFDAAAGVPAVSGQGYGAAGGRRCTADIGALHHMMQQLHHSPAAAAAAIGVHAHRQQQQQQQQQQQCSSEARRGDFDGRLAAHTAASRRGSSSGGRVSFDLSNTSRKSSSEQPTSTSSTSSSRRPSLDKGTSNSYAAVPGSRSSSVGSSAAGAGSARRPRSSKQQQGKPGVPAKAQLSWTHDVAVHHMTAATAVNVTPSVANSSAGP
ncbi:hypothetical protein COO60DRAFT_1690895 [Scenedesmus sp. NREL 46B-D3]|nr:hypothetical protein COO60DRAFT_1690895 [Scenedesmus sp. NREL 46B-D3]